MDDKAQRQLYQMQSKGFESISKSVVELKELTKVLIQCVTAQKEGDVLLTDTAPLLEKLIVAVEGLNKDPETPKEIDLSKLVGAIEGLKKHIPQYKDRTDVVVKAINSLKTDPIKVEKVTIDLKKVEKSLADIEKKALLAVKLEKGRVPVKFSDEDLEHLSKIFGTGGGRVVPGTNGPRGLVNNAGDQINPATEETLQSVADAVGGGAKATRLDNYSTANVLYVGKAAVGSDEGDPVWQIQKVNKTSGVVVTWAGSGLYTQIWDNRLALTYL